MSLQAAGAFAKGLQQIEGLQLAGMPAMTVVAFRAAKPRKLNIYALNDLMSQRGWHLSALQLPPALHMCFTGQHATIVDSLLKVMLKPWQSLCSSPRVNNIVQHSLTPVPKCNIAYSD